MAVATADIGDARVALAQVRLGDDGEVLVGTALLEPTPIRRWPRCGR